MHGQKSAIDAANPETDIDNLRAEYYGNKNEYNQKMEFYKTFSETVGLPAQTERIYYDGLGRMGGKVPQKWLNYKPDKSTVSTGLSTGGGRMGRRDLGGRSTKTVEEIGRAAANQPKNIITTAEIFVPGDIEKILRFN